MVYSVYVLNKYQKVLLYCYSVKHTKHINQMLKELGFLCEIAIDHDRSEEEYDQCITIPVEKNTIGSYLPFPPMESY